MIDGPCECQPTLRDWLTAIALVFRTALRYPDAGTRWLARLIALMLLVIPTLLTLGLCGLLP